MSLRGNFSKKSAGARQPAEPQRVGASATENRIGRNAPRGAANRRRRIANTPRGERKRPRTAVSGRRATPNLRRGDAQRPRAAASECRRLADRPCQIRSARRGADKDARTFATRPRRSVRRHPGRVTGLPIRVNALHTDADGLHGRGNRWRSGANAIPAHGDQLHDRARVFRGRDERYLTAACALRAAVDERAARDSMRRGGGFGETALPHEAKQIRRTTEGTV